MGTSAGTCCSSWKNLLEATINAAGVGVFDGSDVPGAGRDGYLYMTGPDRRALLFRIVRPILESVAFMHDAVVRLRYGPPRERVPERMVKLVAHQVSIA